MDENNVSVIVPVYNSSKYLAKCVDSLIAAKGILEIILVDDGSTDGSNSICDKYANENFNIKTIHTKNQGSVCARKTGVSLARGEYIGFVDSDDWIENDYFANMYSRMMDNDCEVVCSSFCEEKNGKKIIRNNALKSGFYTKNRLVDIKNSILFCKPYYSFGIYPSLWSKLFKKSIINSIYEIPNKITLGDDAALTYPAIFKSSSIYIDNENSGYHYRCVETSITNKFSGLRDKQIVLLINYLEEYFYDSVYSKSFFEYYRYMIKGFFDDIMRSNEDKRKVIKGIDFFSKQINTEILLDTKNLPFYYKPAFKLFYKKKYDLLYEYLKLLKIIRHLKV